MLIENTNVRILKGKKMINFFCIIMIDLRKRKAFCGKYTNENIDYWFILMKNFLDINISYFME